MSAAPTILLNNGVEIPQLGLGVFQIEPDRTTGTLAAIEVGYRHIDTAEMYGNEKQVGQAVRASGLEEIHRSGRADTATITGLNRDERTGPDPGTFAYLPR